MKIKLKGSAVVLNPWDKIVPALGFALWNQKLGSLFVVVIEPFLLRRIKHFSFYKLLAHGNEA